MRKIAILTVMLACAGVLLFAGCGEKGTSGGGETPVELPPRDTSTVETSLLGHWQDGAGNELYFSPDTVTFIAAETGEEYSSGYVIVSTDDNIKRMDLEFTQPGDIFYAADPSRAMYATVFFRRPGMDGLIFGADFFSRDAETRLGLTETEYPFVDTMQSPQ
jgi:predicted small lipoprotein YifL